MPRSAGGRRKCVREEMRRVASHVTRNRRGQAPRWGAGVRRCLARPTGLLSADRGKRGSGGARSSRQGWDGGWDGTGKGGMEPARLWLSHSGSARPARSIDALLDGVDLHGEVHHGPVMSWPVVAASPRELAFSAQSHGWARR